MIKDTFDSLAKWWNERTSSPLYGTFIVAVVLVNWDVFYTLFWESDSKFNVPRVEYVRQTLLVDLDWVAYCRRTLLPIVVTYFVICWLPYLSDWAFDRTQSFYYNRLRKSDERKTEYLAAVAEAAGEQKKSKEKIVRSTDSEEILDMEFREFQKNHYFMQFGFIIYAVLKSQGLNKVPVDVLAYFKSQDLVQIGNNGISFTKKGEIFFKKFSEQQPELLQQTMMLAENRDINF